MVFLLAVFFQPLAHKLINRRAQSLGWRVDDDQFGSPDPGHAIFQADVLGIGKVFDRAFQFVIKTDHFSHRVQIYPLLPKPEQQCQQHRPDLAFGLSQMRIFKDNGIFLLAQPF